ncbi:MAG: DUF4397 domain-containing protein [Sphingobacteriaceae bacterium]
MMTKLIKTQRFFRSGALPLPIFCLIMMLCSCVKNDDNGAADQKAQLAVFHTAPDVAKIDFYLNGSKQNVSPLSFSGVINYAGVPAGDQTADVKIPVTNAIITFAPVSLMANVRYSIFVMGLSNSNNLSTVLLVDTVGDLPGAGRAKIRFIQSSPTIQSMDLLANDSTFFTNRGFKTATPFTEIAAKAYAFKVAVSGSPNVLMAKDSINLQEGRLYTLYTRGLVSVDTPNVKAFRLTHFNNDN